MGVHKTSIVISMALGEKTKKKLTVSSSEVGQRVITLLTVHNILEVQKKKEAERTQEKAELNSFFLFGFL